MSGIESTGFVRKTLAEIKAEIEDSIRSSLGNAVNLEPPSVFSVLVGIFAEREAILWELAENAYNASYPDTAEGVSLDNAVAYTGITRLGATKSTLADLHLFGTAGTVVPAGTQFSVDGNTAAQFESLADVTLVAGVDEIQTVTFSAVPVSGSFRISYNGEETALIQFNAVNTDVQTALNDLTDLSAVTVAGNFTSGFVVTFAGVDGKINQPIMSTSANTLNGGITITVTETTPGVPQGLAQCESVLEGPYQAYTRTLTVIDTPVSGLDSVLNLTDAVAGTDVETDLELRLRRNESLQIAGAATVDAIYARMLNVDGVTAVNVIENSSDITDGDGRPPHSFEVIITGGTDAAIAQEIWEVKPAGVATYGSTSVNITDTQGFVHVVKFSRPTAVDIWVELDLTVDSNFPVDGENQVKTALVIKGFETFSVGDDVIVIPILIGSFSSIPGILDAVIRVGTAINPTLDNNIPIASTQIAIFDAGKVEVTIL